MCRLLGVPRSSFYAWRNRVETPTAARRRELAEQVRAGVRRLAADLRLPAGRGPAEPGRARMQVGLVADLMRELGLKAVQPRAYKRTTVPGRGAGRVTRI